jgi:hypothetical protein
MSFSWENLNEKENETKVDIYSNLSSEALKQEEWIGKKFEVINQLLKTNVKDKNISIISKQVSEEAISITTLISEFAATVNALSSHIINNCSNASVKKLSLQRHQEILLYIFLNFIFVLVQHLEGTIKTFKFEDVEYVILSIGACKSVCF